MKRRFTAAGLFLAAGMAMAVAAAPALAAPSSAAVTILKLRPSRFGLPTSPSTLPAMCVLLWASGVRGKRVRGKG